MRSGFLLPLLLSSLMLTACGRPAALPVVRVPVPVAVPDFRTSMSALVGEEIELSGIYSPARTGAVLMLRSGEQLRLRDVGGQVMVWLPGVEGRSQLRIRGRLVDTGLAGNDRFALEVRVVAKA